MGYNNFEVTSKDILDLASPDAFALFFAQLGYHTKPATADSEATKKQLHDDTDLLAKIRVCRQLVEYTDETFSRFYVYLYVLPTVNKTLTRSIFRDLCKRQGDFLVVLTNERYETIDMMYIDRSTSIPTAEPIVQPALMNLLVEIPAARVGKAEARIITIDRRHPGKVALRVLNRFHWRARHSSHADGDENLEKRSIAAHCETLQSAFVIAEWSQEYFNNRALFSDHYLINTLPYQQEGDWKATTGSGNEATQFTKSYTSLRRLYDDAHDSFSQQSYALLCQQLIGPVLATLDFVAQPSASLKDNSTKKRLPSYTLCAKDSTGQATSKVAICLAYAWGRNLDGYEEVADNEAASMDETAHENPGAVIVTLLDQESVDWAILTNGKIWRLYAAKTHSSATNYYEIDLEEILAIPRARAKEASDALRYFWLFFRANAFIARVQPGYQEPLSLLDYVLRESEAYAIALGNSLKKKIFEEIFTHFAEGLVHNAQDQGVLPSDLSVLTPEQLAMLEQQLKHFFNANLTFLYRLLFLLYAESRNLLPVHVNSVYYQHSLHKLKQDIAERAGDNAVQAVQKIEQHYGEHSYVLYDALQMLFAAIDKGREDLNVPTYNGGLFITQPGLYEAGERSEVWNPLLDTTSSPEEMATHILATYKISDRHLALGLDKLARDEDSHHSLVFIDYKSLGVRQLGSIYEGLLEFKLRMAGEDMVEIKEKIVPLRAAKDAGHYKSGKQPILPRNSAYIENDRHERKATGSYYTPDYIVEYIIEQTVGPVLDEKEKTLLKKFRDFEAAILQKQKEHKDFLKRGMKPKDLASTYEKYSGLVDEFFDIKVLDPAMGSGHFLVEAVDYITRRMIKFLDKVPINPVRYELKRIENAIAQEMERQRVNIDRGKLTEISLLKRQVLKRCIYGVDLNPMAVELAKVSVWLDSFTLGAPLSFLDHHLKCGNSLIGAKVDEARTAIEEGQLSLFFGGNVWAGALLSTEGMISVSKRSDVTPGQAQESKEEYKRSATAIAPYKRLLNVYLSRWFSNPSAKGKRGHADIDKVLDFLRSDETKLWMNDTNREHLNEEQQIVLAQAEKDHAEHKFFHWELEFPEVFIDLEHASLKSDPGFDAVIGNPPYDELSEDARGSQIHEMTYFQASPQLTYALGNRINIYRLFIAKALYITRAKGFHSFIVPLSLLADNFTLSLREYILNNVQLQKIEQFPQKDNPYKRVFLDAKLSTCIYIIKKNQPDGEAYTYVRTHLGREIDTLSPRYTANQSDFLKFDTENFSLPGLSQTAWNIILKLAMEPNYLRLGKVAKALPGELMINSQFTPYLTTSSEGEEIIRGSHIGMYQIVEPKQGEPLYLNRTKYLSARTQGGKAFHFQRRRVVYQRYAAIDNYRRLIGTILSSGYFCSHTVGYLSNIDINYKLEYFVALMNSTILDWRFNLTSTNNNVNGYEVEALPIPRINFVTPPDQRASYLEKAKLLYSQSIGENNHDGVLGFVNHHLAQEPAASDIVHDLLAFLAEEMLRLNKEKRAIQRTLLAWLVDTLKIQPQADKDGKIGLDALKHKAKLLDYPGDYQKGEPALTFTEVKNILLENKKRLLLPLSEASLANVEEQYQHSLDVVLPLKRQLAQTDKLIDRIVYRLYELTEEEIRIVEGHA